MGSELNLICLQMKLFEQFSSVAMSKDGVRGEIIGCVHEVGLRRRSFSSAAYSGLRVADDAVFNIDEASLKQWRKRKDDRSGIASGIGNDAGVTDLVAMQLRTSIDCFCLQFCGLLGVNVCQTVDGAVDVVL